MGKNFNYKHPNGRFFIREEGKRYLCWNCCTIVNGTIPCPMCENTVFFTPYEAFEDLVKVIAFDSSIDSEDSCECKAKKVRHKKKKPISSGCIKIYVFFNSENRTLSLIKWDFIDSSFIKNAYRVSTMPDLLTSLLENEDYLYGFLDNKDYYFSSDSGVFSAILNFTEYSYDFDIKLESINETDWENDGLAIV